MDKNEDQIWGIWCSDPDGFTGWYGMTIGSTYKPFVWDRGYAEERLRAGMEQSPGRAMEIDVVPEAQRDGFPCPLKDGDPINGAVFGSR